MFIKLGRVVCGDRPKRLEGDIVCIFRYSTYRFFFWTGQSGCGVFIAVAYLLHTFRYQKDCFSASM